ncbi:hypothetical protein MSG28_006775 [Choristoneura fumiferana]|uniref:Uncharacterized protein n=1 Tax=Choristoneura fumiferana TaxID=7141 RepID=A0ACC0JL30_CHOFU|nr:hypothetical protein MSG28_006775 [Choristoneura fumiferana]
MPPPNCCLQFLNEVLGQVDRSTDRVGRAFHKLTLNFAHGGNVVIEYRQTGRSLSHPGYVGHQLIHVLRLEVQLRQGQERVCASRHAMFGLEECSCR